MDLNSDWKIASFPLMMDYKFGLLHLNLLDITRVTSIYSTFWIFYIKGKKVLCKRSPNYQSVDFGCENSNNQNDMILTKNGCDFHGRFKNVKIAKSWNRKYKLLTF